MSLNIHGKPLTSLGFQQLTTFNAAAVKLDVPKGCTHIYWEAHFSVGVIDATEPDVIVMWRDDGTDPTATVGMGLVVAGGNAGFYPGDPEKAAANLRVIGRLSQSVLNVTYYKA